MRDIVELFWENAICQNDKEISLTLSKLEQTLELI